ncbi:hypothetical protein [uncultured Thermosynechococcus sp.]|uniref:hypothetical protein n=1 Tax=uncultured Thermosynechococcus sp. TaxID=436945 RepID=UPI002639FC33|nr:hypothetical protein [uncultured Thermosynechococcus sp.]
MALSSTMAFAVAASKVINQPMTRLWGRLRDVTCPGEATYTIASMSSVDIETLGIGAPKDLATEAIAPV